GGPVYLPKLYPQRNKTFFFLSYEGVKNRATGSSFTRVATDAERRGDFSAIVPGVAGSDPAIFNPFSTRPNPDRAGQFLRDPFPDKVVPASLQNPIAVRFLELFSPKPNAQLAGTLQNYLISGPSKSDSGIWVGRLDHNISDSNRFFVRFTVSDVASSSQGISPVVSSNINEARNAAVEWNRNFTPTLLLNVRYGYNRNRPVTGFSNLDKVQEFIQFAKTSNPDGFSATCSGGALFPGYTVQNYASLVSVGCSENDHISHSGAINVHKFLGRHSFKAGMNLLHLDTFGGSVSQVESFGLQQTQNLISAAGTGQPLASLLLGIPASANRPLGSPVGDQGGWMYAGYLSDTFRVNAKLSINYGLRWDHNGNLITRQRNFGSFDRYTGAWLLEGPTTIPNALFKGPNVRRGFIDPDWNNFSPRFGVAYAITPRTVIRAGYSVFFEMYAAWQQIAQGPRVSWPNSTFQDTGTLNADVPRVFIDRPFVGLPSTVDRPDPFPSAGYHVNRLFKTPYVHEWNFAVERQVTDKLSFTGTYVGASGRKLECCGLTNYASVLGPGVARAPEKVPYPQMLVFRTNDNNGSADYHSLQLSSERRFSRGLTFLFNYTWSKSIDLGCSGYIGAEGCNIQQPYNPTADRGVSTYHLTHISNASFVYELPIGRGKWLAVNNYFLNLALGGWQVSGIVNFRSGLALTPILTTDN
ncbi:MAG: TonB-dependent receptor, partial [Bryobacteraceae bacterium]